MNRKSKKVTQMMRSLSPEPMGISMSNVNPLRRPLTYLSYNQNKLPIAFNITRSETICNRSRKKEYTVSLMNKNLFIELCDCEARKYLI